MDESQLLQKAKNGDQAAFSLLVEQYEKQVYHHALRMVGSPEDAADVTQEVFWKAWRSLPFFQGDSAFSTWLYRLTGNAAIDLLRREKRRQWDLSLDGPEGALQTADPSPTPEQHLEQREQRRSVAQALSRLSDEHRQVLVLREIDGLSYEEISAVLEVPAGTVKSRIARARLALSKILRESGNFSVSAPSNQTNRR